MGLPVHLPNPMAKWRTCPDCDVSWRGAATCWSCGNKVAADGFTSGPAITSASGFGTAMSEHHWRKVRREIGVDPE